MFDLHIHTPFSDGQRDLDTILKILIDLGIEIIGFSDHIFPMAIYKHKDGSFTNCFSTDTLKYRKDVFRIYDKKYPEIKILNGGEIDLYPHGAVTLPHGIKPEFFDYLMVAKHHTVPKQLNLFKKRPKFEKWMWKNNPYLTLNTYLWEKGLLKAFQKYRPDVFAHPQEGIPKYISDDIIKRILLYCKKYNVAIEINGSCLNENKLLPEAFFKYGAEYGIEFSLGSDFHGFSSDLRGLLNFSQLAYKKVEEYGLKLIDPHKFIPNTLK